MIKGILDIKSYGDRYRLMKNLFLLLTLLFVFCLLNTANLNRFVSGQQNPASDIIKKAQQNLENAQKDIKGEFVRYKFYLDKCKPNHSEVFLSLLCPLNILHNTFPPLFHLYYYQLEFSNRTTPYY